MTHKPDTPCSRCGRFLWTGSTSAPAAQRTCQPCRRIEPKPYGPRTPTESEDQKLLAAFHARFEPSLMDQQLTNIAGPDGKPLPLADRVHQLKMDRIISEESIGPGDLDRIRSVQRPQQAAVRQDADRTRAA